MTDIQALVLGIRKERSWRKLAAGDTTEEKTRNGILSTLSINPPRKQRMSFRQRSVTYCRTVLKS